MNPLSLRASNYRSFAELELDLSVGCTAIVGDNGAGKSSIVNVIDVALFGPETRTLADHLSDDGASELEIELTFEHAGELYRVRRGYSAKGRGKTTLDFERNVGPDDGYMGHAMPNGRAWEPLTRESQKATQEAIEEVLGLSRETFRASAFLAQGDGAAFTEAVPRDRKRILADVLGLQRWDRLRDAVSSDRRHTERLAGELVGRISLLSENGSHAPELEAECSRLRLLVSDTESEHAQAGGALDAAAVAVQELERAQAAYRERKAAYEAAKTRLDAHAKIEDDAFEAAELEAGVRHELASLPTELQMQKAILDETELRKGVDAQREAVAAWSAAKGAHDAALTRRSEILGRASTLNEEAHALREQAGHALSHAGEARCTVCEQVLGSEAAQTSARNLEIAAQAKDTEASALDELAKASEIPELGEEPVFDAALAGEHSRMVEHLERTRTSYMQRSRLEERLAGYLATTAKAKTPEYRLELDALKEAARLRAVDLDNTDEPEPGALDAAKVGAVTAKAQVDIVAEKLSRYRDTLARVETSLEAAQKTAADLADAQGRHAEMLAELDVLTTLERAFGRDGIPSLIVEVSAIPTIETEANRILTDLGTSYRVELRTQRELKSGDGLADTLDVVVIGDAGERAYETFSGGERSRLNVALRLALASLLANRRGAESRVLVLDEVEYLDEVGQAKLVDVLLALRDRFDKILVVSHVSGLREAPLDAVLGVVKVDGRSRVETPAGGYSDATPPALELGSRRVGAPA